MPDALLNPNHNWKTYRAGEGDRAARKIDRVYAFGEDYIIYFSGCELFYEIGPTVAVDLGNADVALARINRLLPYCDPTDMKSEAYRYKYSTLELVADAYEMIFCGEVSEGLTILNDIRDKLQTTAEGKRRLYYQAGAISTTVVGWLIYLVLHHRTMPRGWEPWMLAAVLAMAGGAFSVCLNLGSLVVSVNQRKSFLFAAGATRSVVALLAGIGLLLAMRARMLAGFAYQATLPPAASAGLVAAEMFFCFLAGFSETFVPNILRESEENPGGGSVKAAELAKTAEQAKGALDAKAVTKTTDS